MKERIFSLNRLAQGKKGLTLSIFLIAFSCCFYIAFPMGNGVTMRMLDIGMAFSVVLSWKAWVRRKRTQGFDKTEWCMIAFFICCFISILVACMEHHALYLTAWLRAVRLGYLFVGFQIAQLWNEAQKQLFWKSLLWFGSAQAAFALVMYFLQIEAFCASQTTWKNGQLIHRASGFVSDAASFAFLCTVLVLISAMTVISKTGTLRVLGGVCFLLNVIGLWASNTRTAMIAAAVTLLLIGVDFFARKRIPCLNQLFFRVVRRCIVVLFVCGGMALVLINLFFAETFSDWMDLWMQAMRTGGIWFRLNALFSERLYIWAQYLQILTSQPIQKLFIGNGYYLFENIFDVGSFSGSKFILHRPTHNMFLNILMGTGLFGWFLSGGMLDGLVKFLEKAKTNMLTTCAQVLFFSQLIFMIFDDSLSMVNSSILTFIFLAFVMFSVEDRWDT